MTGLTQQQVADDLKIGRTAYTNYENGTSSIPDDILDRFVKKCREGNF